jgi:uncharacterized protein (DUF697 family)
MDLQESQARRIITRHMWLAMGAGLLPLAFLDYAMITGVQLRMLRQLSHNYQVPFSRHRGKTIIAALLGTIIPLSLTNALASVVKMVPVAGAVIGGMSVAIFAGATTYAIGKIFLQHFESGGTFLDLEPATVREYFRQEFEKGQRLARDMHRTAGVTPVPTAAAPAEPPSHVEP